MNFVLSILFIFLYCAITINHRWEKVDIGQVRPYLRLSLWILSPFIPTVQWRVPWEIFHFPRFDAWLSNLGKWKFSCGTLNLWATTFQQHGTTGSSIYICPSLDNSPFPSQSTQERVIYLFRKPWIVAVESSCENGSKFVMEGSRRVLVKMVGLFLVHWNLMTCLYWASWLKKELYTSLGSPE